MTSAERLGEVVRRSSAAHVAKAVAADESAVRHWVAGRRTPKEPWRTRLHEAFDIDPSSWPADPVPVPHAPKAKSTPRAPDPPGAVIEPSAIVTATTAAAKVDAIIARVEALLAQAESDPMASYRDKAALITTATTATRLLAKLSGELEISFGTIQRSKAWGDVERAMIEAFDDYPEAAEAFAAAIRRLGADS